MMSFFLLLKVPFSSFSESLFLSFSKSLFRPPQSPVSVLSVSRSRPLQVQFPSSPSSSLISKSSPLLPDSRARPLHPLPFLSKSSPLLFLLAEKKTAERHEAVPPFLWLLWLVLKRNILPLLRCSEQFGHGSHFGGEVSSF